MYSNHSRPDEQGFVVDAFGQVMTEERSISSVEEIEKSGTIDVPRTGCKDIWGAYMVKGAMYGKHDIPLCPTTTKEVPKEIITWVEAKSIYKKQMRLVGENFRYDAFVCFYLDDHLFDGVRGVWHDSTHALEVLQHFAGIITPDFSTYQDFPEPIKLYNTYRMRAFGYWLGENGISVINNVRWGTEETYGYCFEGVEKHSVVAIGTVGGSPYKYADRVRFERGLDELIRVLAPHTIIVYGSAKYPCFEKLKEQGIRIVAFPSHTAKAFERRKQYEQGV
jgi:hypothetical protein